MKKALIIIGIVLLIIGGIILIISINNYVDPNKITNTHTVEKEFNNFDINLKTSNLEFKLSEDSSIKVVCEERINEYHNVSVEENTLKIKLVDERKWYERIFNWHKNTVIVYLPAATFENLNIISSTGNIKICEDFTFKNLNAKLSTGNVEIKSNVEKLLNIETSTGIIVLNGINANNLNIKCSTGNVSLIKTIVTEHIEIYTSTGNVCFEDSDADTIKVKVSTGNVRGTLLSNKIFYAKTHTGRINVPQSTTGGICEIETSTGNINISIKP